MTQKSVSFCPISAPGSRLRWFRSGAKSGVLPGKISQERLAGFLGVSRSVIQRIENGNQSPSSAELSAWQPLLSEEAKRQKSDPIYAEEVADFVCYGGEMPPPLEEWRAKKKASVAARGTQETTKAVASKVSLTEVDSPPVNLQTVSERLGLSTETVLQLVRAREKDVARGLLADRWRREDEVRSMARALAGSPGALDKIQAFLASKGLGGTKP